jgi:hypothetical protein
LSLHSFPSLGFFDIQYNHLALNQRVLDCIQIRFVPAVMLAEVTMGQDPLTISSGDNLASISELPADVTGKSTMNLHIVW